MDCTVKLRITLIKPPAGLVFCLLRGKGNRGEHLQEVESDGSDIAFDLDIIGRTAGTGVDFFGPFVQGTRDARFFYICVGELHDGNGLPLWTGRVKVPLQSISESQVATVADKAGSLLTAKYQAAQADGRPALATVKLEGGWFVTRVTGK